MANGNSTLPFQSEQSEAHSRPALLISIGLVMLVLLAYGQTLGFEFISMDDPLYLTNNPKILKGFSWEAVRYAFSTSDDGGFLPLVWLSHALCVSLFGLNAGLHHMVNVALHAANTVLLFLLLRSLTRSLEPSAWVAVLFALHPLHVESVAWVSERKDVLSAFFWFLTTAAYVGYVRRPSAARYARMLALFLVGLLSKSMLVTLPLTLLLLDLWPLGRVDRAAPFLPEFRRLLLEKVPLLAMSVGISLLTIRQSKELGALAIQGQGSYPIGIRLGNACVAAVTYLGQMFWPFNLSPTYPHPGFGLGALRVGVCLAILLGLMSVAILQVRKRPYFAVGLAWFLVTVMPVIGIIQVGVQGHADRYTYVPLIGPFLALAWFGSELLDRWPPDRLLKLGLSAGFLTVLTALSYSQVFIWQSSERLFAHALRVNPDSPVAQVSMGDILRREGKIREAFEAYAKATTLLPGMYSYEVKLGASLHLLGRQEEAIAQLRHAHTLNPEDSLADQLLGSILLSLGRLEEAQVAVDRVLVREARRHPDANSGDGRLFLAARIDKGILLRRQHLLRESEAALAQVVTEAPGAWRGHRELALTLAELGRCREALWQLDAAAAASPGNVEVQEALREVQDRCAPNGAGPKPG